MRDIITFECTVCKKHNYTSIKNKRNDPDKVHVNKYCSHCRKHTEHKETK